MKKKNIWFVHHYATLPNLNGFIRPYNFGKFMTDNYNIVIFAAAYQHFSDTNLIDNKDLFLENRDFNIPFVFIRTSSSKKNGIDRIFNMMQFYFNFLRTAKKYCINNEKPDIIIASSPHPLTMIAGIKLAQKWKIPCICEVRDLWPEAIFNVTSKIKQDSFFGKILTKGEHWIYRKANSIIFTKEGDTDYLKEKKWTVEQGGDIDLRKCYYINNGVDLEEYDQNIYKFEIQDDDLLDENKFNVVYSGTVRKVNNVGNILDTAKLLLHKKDIQFLIYGEGNELDSLKLRVENEKIHNVKFKGVVERKYVPFILSKSNVNILNYSSTKYNWTRGNSSNKLFEYMASGKPIVSTVKMGYSIINKYKCGIEIEEDTPQALANAILSIYNMSKTDYERMGNNAREGAKDFDFKVLTKKLINVIEHI